jgi:hypothetical protein
MANGNMEENKYDRKIEGDYKWLKEYRLLPEGKGELESILEKQAQSLKGGKK